MKKVYLGGRCTRFPVFVLPVLVLALISPVPAGAETLVPLVYVPLPLTNAESAVAGSRDLVGRLEEILRRPVQIQFEGDYATILERFARDEIHLAHLGPLPYIALRGAFSHAEPLVLFREADGATTYTCSLASAIDRLGDAALAVGPVALTQPLSTCGYFMTHHLLASSGGRRLEDMPYRFLGSHEEVALALVRGEFEAGGVRTSIGEAYHHVGLQLLVEGPRQPGFALIANRRVIDEATMALLVSRLVATPVAVYRQWQGLGQWGMAAARDSMYQEMRCMEGFIDALAVGGLESAAVRQALEELCAPPP